MQSASTKPSKRALALLSGGLDSMLAVRMIQDQGYQVEGVNFYTTFAGDHDFQFQRPVADSGAEDEQQHGGMHAARRAADELGIKLRILDATMPFQEIMRHPSHGFGSVINPCIDCKLFFIQQAYRLMQAEGFDFLISGEVVDQRPMSQRREVLPLAAKLTHNHLVRPLSAQLLPPSYPEQARWLDRQQLGAISGRRRDQQLALARQFGFQHIPQPAGGCLLTDPGFGRRLKDFLAYFPQAAYTPEQLRLLRVGRHLRISPTLKLVVGRNQWENEWLLQALTEPPLWAQVRDYPGAVVLIQQNNSQDELSDQAATLQLVAKVALYFSKLRKQVVASGALTTIAPEQSITTTSVSLAPAPASVVFYLGQQSIRQLTLDLTDPQQPITVAQLQTWYL